ncbi:uncharacterized protein G2W53_025619 [Senna tora]|uniref:Uncharacterized protein n=1 Tax=Senna tora TaxID=362788 RepID=A0A834TFQ0_9FABA|nr:uncharacterized protein G2W53_025619 [Senna tora]
MAGGECQEMKASYLKLSRVQTLVEEEEDTARKRSRFLPLFYTLYSRKELDMEKKNCRKNSHLNTEGKATGTAPSMAEATMYCFPADGHRRSMSPEVEAERSSSSTCAIT